MKRVLITGGAGAMGRELVGALLRRGYRVRIFDLPSPRLSILGIPEEVEFAGGDITDEKAVLPAALDADVIVHAAALLPPVSERSRTRTWAVNVRGTSNILKAIRQRGRRSRLIFTSTVATYGDTTADRPPLPVDHPQRPNSIYSESKVEAERAILASGVPCTILRISAVVAPVLADPPPWPFVPDQRVEFVERSDVVRALAASVERDDATGKIFHVAGGKSWQMLGREYIARIFPILDIPVENAVYPEMPVYSDWYDTDEARRILDFQSTGFPRYLELLEEAVAKALA